MRAVRNGGNDTAEAQGVKKKKTAKEKEEAMRDARDEGERKKDDESVGDIEGRAQMVQMEKRKKATTYRL